MYARVLPDVETMEMKTKGIGLPDDGVQEKERHSLRFVRRQAVAHDPQIADKILGNPIRSSVGFVGQSQSQTKRDTTGELPVGFVRPVWNFEVKILPIVPEL